MGTKFMWIAIIGIAAGVAIASLVITNLRAGGKAPAIGSAAPDFTLHSQSGEAVSLHDFRGKWVVLYFYPKDMTPGCTVEAHNFQRDLAKYNAKNAVILGVSVQDEKSHEEFCTKESLTFRLLADTKKEVSGKYDSVLNLGVTKISARHTFLIDPNGVVRKVWTDVKVGNHSDEVLAAVEQLEKAAG
ncbi:MAG TPA: peroxiredoxin [Candidatus Eisenbacteria bacterium]|nr:peroxiredoxin [Candidatus Eisenbacteria bacterium]